MSEAAKEWQLEDLPAPLSKSISCECRGTPIKRTARIGNRVTGATLIIGLVCYDRLIEGVRERGESRGGLVSRPRFLDERKRRFEDEFHRSYVQYFEGVDLKSWKMWLIGALAEGDDVPEDIRRDGAELARLGFVLLPETLDRLRRFHDEHRRFPRHVLLPADWARWMPQASPVLTVSMARALVSEIRRLKDERNQPISEPVTEKTAGPREQRRADKPPFRQVLDSVRRALSGSRAHAEEELLLRYVSDAAAACSGGNHDRLKEVQRRLAEDLQARAQLLLLYADWGPWRLLRGAVPGDLLWRPSDGLRRLEDATDRRGLNLSAWLEWRGESPDVTAEHEATFLRQLLGRHGGDIAAAAKASQIDRRTLRQLIDKYKILT